MNGRRCMKEANSECELHKDGEYQLVCGTGSGLTNGMCRSLASYMCTLLCRYVYCTLAVGDWLRLRRRSQTETCSAFAQRGEATRNVPVIRVRTQLAVRVESVCRLSSECDLRSIGVRIGIGVRVAVAIGVQRMYSSSIDMGSSSSSRRDSLRAHERQLERLDLRPLVAVRVLREARVLRRRHLRPPVHLLVVHRRVHLHSRFTSGFAHACGLRLVLTLRILVMYALSEYRERVLPVLAAQRLERSHVLRVARERRVHAGRLCRRLGRVLAQTAAQRSGRHLWARAGSP